MFALIIYQALLYIVKGHAIKIYSNWNGAVVLALIIYQALFAWKATLSKYSNWNGAIVLALIIYQGAISVKGHALKLNLAIVQV